MLAGQVYSAVDADLLKELGEVREAIHRYNSLAPSRLEERLAILKGLLGAVGDDEIIVNQALFLRLREADQGRETLLCQF